MLRAARRDRRASSGSRSRPSGRRRAAAVRGRVVRPRARPRGAAPPARPRPRAGGVPARARARAARSRSWASRRATATGSRRCRSALGALAAPAWRRLMRRRRPRRNGAAAGAGPTETTYGALEALVDVHTFTPGDAARRSPRDAGFTDVRVSRRGAGRERLRLVAAHARVRRRPEHACRCAWHQFAFRSYLALQWLDGRLLEPRLPAEPLLQPAALRPQARLTSAAADAYTGRDGRRRATTSRSSRCRSCCCRPRWCRSTSSRSATRR